MLSNWTHIVQIGKTTASQDDAPNEKLGPCTWQPYSEAQVDSAVVAFERLTASIEERMAAIHRLSLREGSLLSDEDSYAASVPSGCVIRSLLARARKSRFRMVAPRLEVPHDPAAFTEHQEFTAMNASSEYVTTTTPHPPSPYLRARRTICRRSRRARSICVHRLTPSASQSETVSRGATAPSSRACTRSLSSGLPSTMRKKGSGCYFRSDSATLGKGKGKGRVVARGRAMGCWYLGGERS